MKVIRLFFFILPLVTLSCAAGGQIIRTIAGSGSMSFSGDGGMATLAGLSAPSRTATDHAGNIYVSDDQRIRKISPAGIITTIAGTGDIGYNGDGGPATAAWLNYPSSLAVDGAGNVFVADGFNNRIRKINAAGIISTVAGTGASGFSGDGGRAVSARLQTPLGLAIDTAGNLYIADYFNNRIRKVSTGGIITTIGGSGTAGYSGDGGPANAAEMLPFSLSVDRRGNVYFADEGNSRVRKINTAGIVTTIAGTGFVGNSGDGGPATAAQLNAPSDAAVDSAGNVYITDYGNNTIRRIDTSGIITLFAGTGTASYSGDGGPATAAELHNPLGISFDPAGNIYFADNDNYRVRVVTPGRTAVAGISKAPAGMVVYPNPANGAFTIMINTLGKEDARVVISDILGAKASELSISTNQPVKVKPDLLPGIYIITAETSTERWSSRIVIGQ